MLSFPNWTNGTCYGSKSNATFIDCGSELLASVKLPHSCSPALRHLTNNSPGTLFRPVAGGTHQIRAAHQPQNRKALSLDVPAQLLAHADAVIE
jgi:hypothetical protein